MSASVGATPAWSVVDEVESHIRDLLRSYPTLPATMMAELISWQHGLTVFEEHFAAYHCARNVIERGFNTVKQRRAQGGSPRRSSR